MGALQYTAKYVKVDDESPVYNSYAGVIIAILFSNLAAMYVAVMTVHAGMDWIKGLFFQYHNANALSCFLGIYEMGFILLNFLWAQSISFLGYYMGYAMWNEIGKIQVVEKRNVEPNDGMKFLILGMEMAVGAWIAGLALGEQA